jgi:hypothetical protein
VFLMAEIKSTLDIIEQVKALPWKSGAAEDG